MDMTIFDLHEDMIDRFISQDTDLYSRVIRQATNLDPTLDLLIHIRTFAVDNNHIIIEFPNGNVLAVDISASHYHKIEAM